MMKKRYAQLALMMTSMMSSQLLWGAQATAAEFKDVRHTSWLRSDDKQKLLDPDTSTEMLKIQRFPERSAQEIFKNFETMQIIPASEHRQYLTHGLSHAISTFFMELLLSTPYATEKCSITDGDVPQTPANMKAINIILDDPRSKIREFYKQNPGTSLQSDRLKDLQLLKKLEDLELLEDTSQDAGISKLLHNTNFVSRLKNLKNAENLKFLKHKKLVDRLNNPKIVKEWQDSNRFAVGINLIGLLSTKYKVDDFDYVMERIIGILEKVDNIEADNLRIWRPIVSALPYYMTIHHERDLKYIIDIIARHAVSLLQGDRHLLCARLLGHIYPNSHYTKILVDDMSSTDNAPYTMLAETAITAIIEAVVQLPVTPFDDQYFIDICTHFINLMQEKGWYAVRHILTVVAHLPVTLFNDQYFIDICTHFINLMPKKWWGEIQYILTAIARISTNLFNNKYFIDICDHFINLMPKNGGDEIPHVVEAVAHLPVTLFNDQYFIAICDHFINLMPEKERYAVLCIVVAVAHLPVTLFNDQDFIAICTHFINLTIKKGGYEVLNIVEAVATLRENLFNDQYFIDICDHFINLMPEKGGYEVPRIVEAVARISTNLFNNKHFSDICTHFINLMPKKGWYEVQLIVEAVAKIPVELFNNKCFIDICDHFINQMSEKEGDAVARIVEAVAALPKELFDDKDEKNRLRNQKIINDHMQNYGIDPYSYKIVDKNDQ